jgi:uncharacterized protein YecE (DUF72 family)
MAGIQIAVELRKLEWFDERHLDGTLAFLRSRDIAHVAVDVPQGLGTSLPSIGQATSS